MSTNLAYSRPSGLDPDVDLDLDPAGDPAGRRGPIEIVTSRSQRKARPRIVYALVATAALFVLLLTQLGISIALSDGAYQISSLQNTQTELTRNQQKFHEKLGVLSSPQNVANNATALGMVRNQNPVYLDLSNETVYGTPTAAAAEPTNAPGNVIDNSLLKGVPVVAKGKAPAEKPATGAAPGSTGNSSATTGAATAKSGSPSVASPTNQLAAPETR